MKVNFGVIGATGLVGRAHLDGCRAIEDCNLAAVSARTKESLDRRGDQYGVKKRYVDWHDLVKDPDVEVVDICTPPYLHMPMAVVAAEAGKHVIVEKPMARSTKECDEMIDATRRNSVKLMVAESYVFTTPHVKARELIDQGAIGKPVFLRENKGMWLRQARYLGITTEQVRRQRLKTMVKEGEVPWRIHPTQAGGGRFLFEFDHAIHFFAIARYLMQGLDIEEVTSTSRSYEGERRGVKIKGETVPIVTWRYKGGINYGLWTRTDQPGNYGYGHLGFKTIVNGAEGCIEVFGEGGGSLSGRDVAPLTLYQRGKTTEHRIDEGPDWMWQSVVNYYSQAHTNELRHFVECVAEDKKPLYAGEDGKKDIQLTLTLIKSAMEKRSLDPADLPEDWTAY